MNEDKPRESNAVDYFLSLKSKMEQLIRTADIADRDPRSSVRGGLTTDRAALIDLEVQDAVKRFKAGENFEKIAEDIGISGNALRRRLQNRGISRTSLLAEMSEIKLDKCQEIV